MMHYFLAIIGVALSGIGLASGNQLSILSGTIYLCSGFIVLAIQQRKR